MTDPLSRAYKDSENRKKAEQTERADRAAKTRALLAKVFPLLKQQARDALNVPFFGGNISPAPSITHYTFASVPREEATDTFGWVACSQTGYKAELSVTVVCSFARHGEIESLTVSAEGHGRMTALGSGMSPPQVKPFDVPFKRDSNGNPTVDATALQQAMAKVIEWVPSR